MTRFPYLAFVGALCACATSAPAPAVGGPSPCEYYALAVGNRWTYDGPPGADGHPEAIHVTISTHRDGAYQDDKGSALSCGPDGLRDGNRYLLKAPLIKGASWVNVVGVSSKEEYEVVDVGSSVGVPAGTFHNTVTVRARNRIDDQKSLINETTFAPGVGIIRFATSLDDRGDVIPQIMATLRSFEPAPQQPGS